MKITLTESSPQSDVPLMKLLQPPETASPSGSGGKRDRHLSLLWA